MSALQEIAVDLEANRAVDPAQADRGLHTNTEGLWGWIKGLSIGRKITLFFGINLSIALIAGVGVAIAFVEIGDRAEQLAKSHHRAFVVEKAVIGLSQAQRHRESYFEIGDAVRGNAALDEFDRVLISLETLSKLPDPASSSHSTQLSAVIRAVIEHCRELNLALSGNLQGRSAALKEESDNQVNSTLAMARALSKTLEEEASATSASNRSLLTSMLTLWIGAIAFLCLLTLIAQQFFSRHVGAALSGLAGQMTRLSSGEQIEEFQESDRQDEIGDMTRAMMVFHRAGMRLERLSLERSQNAREELQEQARLQEQKEEARLERENTLRKFADSFERKIGDVVGQVANATSQLQTTASSMASSAQQASTRTGEVTSAMREANTGANAAAAASDEFAVSIGEVSRQAAASAQLARQASSSTDKADETITKLSNSAEQIGQVVGLIQTIAQRTNLLALNASIEAARGGETGRGFAVVASEVKELAMQTSRATEEVSQKIREMQDTTGASVTALRSIASEVAELENVAVSIASAVDEQSMAGGDLARSIEMAARGTEEVAGHTEEVQQLSVSTGAAASQVLSSATALEQQAATLRAQVNGFLDEVRAG
ncbi:MAG: methyl-accepting chemotaxis protein [Erythrobacter sp.]|uniref:methyl-accepting chemotaxis protein n=1 Tax=Erythrobacter sp. TaxID=1042 RepID=UPI0032665A56